MEPKNPVDDLMLRLGPHFSNLFKHPKHGSGDKAHAHQGFNPLANLPQITAAVAGVGGLAYGAIEWAGRQVSGLGASSSDGNAPQQHHDKHLDLARRWWPGGRKKRVQEALGYSHDLPGSGWGEAYRLAEQGLELEGRMQVEEAARIFERVVSLDPKNAPFIARLSKQYSDIMYLPGTTEEKAREYNLRAIELAQDAIQKDPSCVLGYLADCISRGRLALLSDNKNKIKLAKEARESAVKAINIDPANDIALHLMGRWHFEMANINFIARALVQVMYGTSLPEGTYKDALSCYEEAVKAAPNRLIHRVEAGRLHLKLGNKDKARQLLESGLTLDITDINDYLTRKDAELLLKECKRGIAGLP